MILYILAFINFFITVLHIFLGQVTNCHFKTPCNCQNIWVLHC